MNFALFSHLLLMASFYMPYYGFGQEKEVKEYLPIKLYFENDSPRKDDVWSYAREYELYNARQATYCTQGLKEEIDQINLFFDVKLDKEKERLDQLCQAILTSINKGKILRLQTRGYASPLYKNEYNYLLSDRRMESVEIYISEWNNNALKKFIGKELIFIRHPFGEFHHGYQASDVLADSANSVFSMGAILSRRVEIYLEQENLAALKVPILNFENTIHFFDSVVQGDSVIHSFKYSNQGTADLEIINISSGCGCTVAKWENTIVKPGDSEEIHVTFNSRDKIGPQQKSISIETNGSPKFITISLIGEVVTTLDGS